MPVRLQAAPALTLDVCVGAKDLQAPAPCSQWDSPPFKTIMSANRAEIAVRINRAATELNMETVRGPNVASAVLCASGA